MLCRIFSQETVNKLEALENVNKVIMKNNNITPFFSIGFKSNYDCMLRISMKDHETVEFNLYHYNETYTVNRIDTHFFPVLVEEDLEKVIKFVDNIR